MLQARFCVEFTSFFSGFASKLNDINSLHCCLCLQLHSYFMIFCCFPNIIDFTLLNVSCCGTLNHREVVSFSKIFEIYLSFVNCFYVGLQWVPSSPQSKVHLSFQQDETFHAKHVISRSFHSLSTQIFVFLMVRLSFYHLGTATSILSPGSRNGSFTVFTLLVICAVSCPVWKTFVSHILFFCLVINDEAVISVQSIFH